MIRENLNKMIMDAMKAHAMQRVIALRDIKTAFMNWETAKENVGKTLDDATEIRILKKMVDQRMESHRIYHEACRYELAGEELAQADIINDFLPKEASEAEITEAFLQVKEELGLESKRSNMGVFVKEIKKALPNADGKLVAQIVQKNLVL